MKKFWNLPASSSSQESESPQEMVPISPSKIAIAKILSSHPPDEKMLEEGDFLHKVSAADCFTIVKHCEEIIQNNQPQGLDALSFETAPAIFANLLNALKEKKAGAKDYVLYRHLQLVALSKPANPNFSIGIMTLALTGATSVICHLASETPSVLKKIIEYTIYILEPDGDIKKDASPTDYDPEKILTSLKSKISPENISADARAIFYFLYFLSTLDPLAAFPLNLEIPQDIIEHPLIKYLMQYRFHQDATNSLILLPPYISAFMANRRGNYSNPLYYETLKSLDIPISDNIHSQQFKQRYNLNRSVTYYELAYLCGASAALPLLDSIYSKHKRGQTAESDKGKFAEMQTAILFSQEIHSLLYENPKALFNIWTNKSIAPENPEDSPAAQSECTIS